MSVLPSMEKLLEGVEVIWTMLGDERFIEIANSARKPVKAALREAGDIPYYGANNIQDYVHSHTHEGNYVLIAEDGSASLERYSVQYASGKLWANNHVHVVRGKAGLETKFLYHYLQTVNFIPFLNGGDRAKLTKGELVKIPIPIPPLNVQAEIVRILDAFTAYTAELTAELTARKKQYNHYRDQLLKFDEDSLINLKDCCESISDGDHQAPEKTEFGIPFVTISNISAGNEIDFFNTKFVPEDYYSALADKRQARKDDILYTVVGSFGVPVFISENKKFAFQRHIAILRPDKEKIIPKYLYHVLNSSRFFRQASAVAVGAAQKTITLSALNKLRLPLPHADEQARIVAILDKFDALTASISEGLPREIELRQKQYEYYRDRLLSFPKPANNAVA